MTELDRIKAEKEESIRQNFEQRQSQESLEKQLEEIARQTLSDKARARLGNVKLVNKEIYLKAIQAIIYLFRAGELSEKMNEEQLKALLKKLGEKRDISIKRK